MMNYLQRVGNNTPIKEEKKELKLKMKQRLTRKELKEGNGITLIALVVTIVVLLILAGITINYVFSEGGLFDTAKNSGNTWQNAQNSDINALNDLNGMIGNLVNGTGNGGTTTPTEPDTPTPTKVLAESVKMSKTSEIMFMDETLTLTATVLPENTSNKTLTWTSSNEAVATVNATGVITLISAGKTTITAATTDGSNKAGTCTVTINNDTSTLAQFAKAGTFVTENYEELADKYGNKVRVPKGFKVARTEEITVPAGIVIEDMASTEAVGTEGTEGYKPATTGNQFVWIPVGTVYMDEARTAEKAKQVQLGRYAFDTWNGELELKQAAFNTNGTENYINEDGTVGNIDGGDDYNHFYFSELSTSREGVIDTTETSFKNDLNTTAKELGVFLTSAKNNGGYYIARFEASYGSGYDPYAGSSESAEYTEVYANAKPLSKVSTASNINYDNVGTLWNTLTQLEASKVARNMYNNDENVGVESDLMNSYAWDTAIVYIRQMKEEYSNFANYDYTDVGSKTSKDNTGANDKDKFCNIYDMVANCWEWTTEYCSESSGEVNYPCVSRGGVCGDYSSISTGDRNRSGVDFYYEYGAFRPICYIK